jgi:hypothetical protein
MGASASMHGQTQRDNKSSRGAGELTEEDRIFFGLTTPEDEADYDDALLEQLAERERQVQETRARMVKLQRQYRARYR